MKRILCTVLAGLLCLSLLAGCQQNPPEPSPTPEPTAAPTAEPTPELAPTPEPTPFVPAEDIIPPDPETASKIEREPDSFEARFSQNPIDKAYDEEYRQAMSFSMIRQACDTAARRWKAMVEASYNLALAVTTDTGKIAKLKEEQANWEEICENRVQIIREEAPETNEGLLTAAREIVLLYRDRAMELCRVYFDATGELPEFPAEEAVG